jgi:putative Holliday junction resolvase
MGRILSIDYGRKRVGLAVTDELKIIANSLATIPAKDIFSFLEKYISRENVEKILVGEPRQMNNTASEAATYIEPFVNKLKKTFPDIEIIRFDERFTSKMAFQTMLDSGIKKKARQDKALIDRISATILLQSYLDVNEIK